jgi:hypothetical protein
MPLPPLSPAERRLGTFAGLSAALYAASGLFFAAFPGLTLTIASQGGPIRLEPGARLWHALSISMMAMLALCCWLASRSPRENRKLLLPVILSKAVSVLMAIAGLLTWKAFSPEAFSGRRTLLTTIATDLPLLLATAWFYWRAAPGVILDSRPAAGPPAPDAASKPVPLGLAKSADAKPPAGPTSSAATTPAVAAAGAKPPA